MIPIRRRMSNAFHPFSRREFEGFMSIKTEDEVAVLPSSTALPSEVLEIAEVTHAGPVFIQLADGRLFAALGGMGLNNHQCIVPARAEHRIAIRKRSHREMAHEIGS